MEVSQREAFRVGVVELLRGQWKELRNVRTLLEDMRYVLTGGEGSCYADLWIERLEAEEQRLIEGINRLGDHLRRELSAADWGVLQAKFRCETEVTGSCRTLGRGRRRKWAAGQLDFLANQEGAGVGV